MGLGNCLKGLRKRVKLPACWQAAAPHKQLDEAEIKICFQLKGRL